MSGKLSEYFTRKSYQLQNLHGPVEVFFNLGNHSLAIIQGEAQNFQSRRAATGGSLGTGAGITHWVRHVIAQMGQGRQLRIVGRGIGGVMKLNRLDQAGWKIPGPEYRLADGGVMNVEEGFF